MKTKKTLNRREFMGINVAGSAVLLTQGCGILNNQNTTGFQTTAPQPLRIRKNIECLNDDEKKLLKKVVRTLKDNGTWFKLAEIHKDRCSSIHQTEFFLPWHRAYLNYFEQAARKLPDCSDFTIPYWDWTTSSKIPLIFGENPDKPWDNDLDSIAFPTSWGLQPDSSPRRCPKKPLWERCPKPTADAGKQIEGIEKQNIYAIIGRDRTNSYAGKLESGSHAIVHDFIEGNMKLPETAALDPIFWLHHANIDRLWSKWMENNLKETPSPNCPIEGCENCKNPPIIKKWLESPIIVESNSSNLKVYDLIDNRKLGYIYEKTPEIIVWNDCPKFKIFQPDFSVKSNFDPKTVYVNNPLTVGVPAAFTTPDKLNNLQNIQNSIFEFLQKRLATGDSVPPSLLLTIEVEKPGNPAISVMVFINPPRELSHATVDSPSYVATFSFFESIAGNHHDDSASGGKVGRRHFIFDVTSNILNLENFDLGTATISIYPKLLQEETHSDLEKITLLSFGFSLVQYQNEK